MTSIKRVIEIVDYYGRAAGARLNMMKFEVMFVNTPVPGGDQIQFKIKEDHMKVLGIYVGVDSVEARDFLWSEIISKMQRCLNYWKMPDLKLKGKVIVVNILILSKMIYALSSVDLWAVSQINSIITAFIWSSKKSLIARKTLLLDFDQGGLKLMDIESKKKALRMKIIIKYLYDKAEYGWKHLFRYYLNTSPDATKKHIWRSYLTFTKKCYQLMLSL